MPGLGRRVPTDWVHVEKYPLRSIQPGTIANVERKLKVNADWIDKYDQGEEGACVGFSASFMMSIVNRQFYDAVWLYREAQEVDEWDDTPPEEGTSVRAAMDILRDKGHRRYYKNTALALNPGNGIERNRWAVTVDEVRTSIANGIPSVLGCWWYSNFDEPVVKKSWFGLIKEYWIGEGQLGPMRGGHAICVYAASDKRQAVGLVNSWGRGYPRVWMPYMTFERMIKEEGEVTLITDR